jgi:hypothetical protein
MSAVTGIVTRVILIMGTAKALAEWPWLAVEGLGQIRSRTQRHRTPMSTTSTEPSIKPWVTSIASATAFHRLDHRLPPPHASGGSLRATRAGCSSAPSARMIQAGSVAGIGARRRCSGTSAAGFPSPADDQCLRHLAVSRLPALAVDLSVSRPPTRSLPRRAAASVSEPVLHRPSAGPGRQRDRKFDTFGHRPHSGGQR